MSNYFYTALGHTVKTAQGDYILFFLSWLDGEWKVIDNGHKHTANQYRLILEAEDRVMEAI